MSYVTEGLRLGVVTQEKEPRSSRVFEKKYWLCALNESLQHFDVFTRPSQNQRCQTTVERIIQA